MPKPTNKEFTLPDNKKITIKVSDMTRAPEILFRPELVGLDHPGVHQLVVNCIKACDMELRASLQG